MKAAITRLSSSHRTSMCSTWLSSGARWHSQSARKPLKFGGQFFFKVAHSLKAAEEPFINSGDVSDRRLLSIDRQSVSRSGLAPSGLRNFPRISREDRDRTYFNGKVILPEIICNHWALSHRPTQPACSVPYGMLAGSSSGLPRIIKLEILQILIRYHILRSRFDKYQRSGQIMSFHLRT